MIRLLLFSLAVVSPAVGQFAGLGSTADGTTLYFSTPLRLRGTDSPFYHKVLRYDTQLSEFLSRDPGLPIGWTTSNFSELMTAQPSRDGSVVAISASRGCYGGSGCLSVQTNQGTIVDRSGRPIFADYGYVSMSPNARWALFYARNSFGSLITGSEVVDLTTGKATTLPYGFMQRARRQVANDGTVAVVVGSALHLWRADGDQVMPAASPSPANYSTDPQVLLSADGRRVVYQTANGLALYDVSAAAETPLATAPTLWASISDDASVIAFVSSADSQVWLASPLRQLTKEPDGIIEVILSGDGRVAYAATSGGRLLRIDVATGGVTELIPTSPWITNSISPVAPGSLYQFIGHNLSPADVRIRIGGMDAPIESLSADQVWFQVPWEVPLQDSAPMQYISGNSPLESPPGTVAVQAVAPGSFTSDSTLIAAHQDFSGPITTQSPAAAGEAIAIYLNGLGAVSPAVATGAISPASPPALVTGPLRCQFWDGGPNDATIFFAGLAPGMVGVYQVSVQVPSGLRVTPVGVTCDFGLGTPAVTGLLPVKL
ncbi:conserved exported hypothetical protein [Candidatus Sulfopaludibacter sp. SbA3]|nr:conserved exported hypothetical protein [Candidatus Sulfopaludibacter sp. SbA3]